jgi:hypothetical protein
MNTRVPVDQDGGAAGVMARNMKPVSPPNMGEVPSSDAMSTAAIIW